MNITVEDFDQDQQVLAYRNKQGRAFLYSANLEKHATRLRLTPLYEVPAELKPSGSKAPEAPKDESPLDALNKVAEKAIKSRKPAAK